MPVLTDFKGKFITFEGIEGVGKTTNIEFVAELITAAGTELITTREPGGTPMGEELRDILLQHHEEEVSDETEILLFFAARAQHVHNVIRPALQAGKCVLCDRFTDATYAYQGGGRGFPVRHIAALEDMVQGPLRPDLTIIFDLPVEVGISRAKGRGEVDRIEKEKLDFFQQVRDAYLAMASNDPVRYRVIDAAQPLVDVQLQLKDLFVS